MSHVPAVFVLSVIGWNGQNLARQCHMGRKTLETSSVIHFTTRLVLCLSIHLKEGLSEVLIIN